MSEIELPPEAVRRILWHAGDCGSREGEWWTFSHDGLLEFATAVAAEQVRAAILAERERCIRIAEGDYEHLTVGIDPHASVGRMIAAAIRRGSV